MVQISDGICNLKSTHLKYRQMASILLITTWNLVQFWNGWFSTQDIAYRPTIWNPNIKKFGIQMFLVFKWLVFRSTVLSSISVTVQAVAKNLQDEINHVNK